MVSMKQYKFMVTTVKKSIILHIKVTCDPSEHSYLHRLFFVNMRIHIIYKISVACFLFQLCFHVLKNL